MKMQKIDLENWNRKEHYEFFSSMDDPFFGLTTELDCLKLYNSAKANGESFFLKYLHKTMLVVNNLDDLNLRIIDDQVYKLKTIHASSTILRDDKTFGITFIEFSRDFDVFAKNAEKEIEALKKTTGLRLLERAQQPDVIHFSPVPWVRFSSMKHPKRFNVKDCIPKISFGKASNVNNQMMIPISIDAHHGLLDGYHISVFLDKLQEEFNNV